MGKTVEGVARLPDCWKAVFIGVNPNSRYADELARHCEEAIPGRYRLLGWCHDVGSALAAFDVFAHPSEHEGFSNSIGEAWLAGIPTVYTVGTGAVPDLGDLGVPVSPDADGEEMAAAILRADRDRDLARRARAVIEAGYPVEHNVRGWTEYLLHVHESPRLPRVLLLASDDAWAFSRATDLAEQAPDVEFCGLALADGTGARLAAAEHLGRRLGCAWDAVESRGDLERLSHVTRPDLVLCAGGRGPLGWRFDSFRLPIVASADGDPGAAILHCGYPRCSAPTVVPRRPPAGPRGAAPPTLVAPPDGLPASSRWAALLSRVANDHVFT